MSNGAAIGYAILAGKRMGMPKEELQELERVMRSEMDFYTEDQAEEVYNNN